MLAPSVRFGSVRFGSVRTLALTALLLGSCALEGDVPGGAGDGAVGVTSVALSPPPESSGCTSAVDSGRQYWFCRTNRSWTTARGKCQGVGLDLASVGGAPENAFIKQRVVDNSWVGGSDSAVEGVWRWASTNVQFWQGASNGSAVGGAYTNWASLQPNSSTQDCAELNWFSGKWSDESCGNSRDYVCEGPADLCPGDPNKDAPGVCGCGNPDTDTDSDGTPDCLDGCDDDPDKTAAGQCGCGSPDTDTDGDGTADCNDSCDEDPDRTIPLCSPDTHCTLRTFGASDYFFCDDYRNHATAKAKCEAVGMQLARIDNAAENVFIESVILTDRWIGGSDLGTEDKWVWEIGGDQFWQGDDDGNAVGGAYENWYFSEPNDLFGQDCLQIEGDGKWWDDKCSDTEQYICERADFVDDDCDGINDLKERAAGLDPLSPDGKTDADGDDVPNADELRFGGDPFDTDTDNDTVLDTTDLLNGTDVEGDGLAYENDNCPWDVNPAQLDADSDDAGDLCDADPSGTDNITFDAFWVTRHSATGSWAIVPTTQVDAQRSIGDRRGQIQTGVSFRMPSELTTATSSLFELYNPATGAHAYTTEVSERDALVVNGFEGFGVIGAVAPVTYGFGEPVQLRRFVKDTGGIRQEAITVDASQATLLFASGYIEVAALGFVQVDRGKFRDPESVVRYVDSVSGAYTHSRLRGADLVTGDDTEGAVFRVFPGHFGGTEPIYRLRSPAGAEVLTASETERATLKSQGHADEGVLGYGMVMASASERIKLPLVALVRFDKASAVPRFGSSPEEEAVLIAAGYGATAVLTHVVPVTRKQVDDRACLGQPTVFQQVSQMFAGAPPPQREAMFLAAMATSCLVQRALTGNATTSIEVLLAEILGLDPDAQTIEEVLREFNIWQFLTEAERAVLLGDLASLDPGDCSDPVPTEVIEDVIREAFGLGELNLNNYTMRAFQCGGGPGVGARDITVLASQQSCNVPCSPNFCEFCGPEDQALAPIAYGVLPSEGVAFGVPAKTCANSDPTSCTPGALIENWEHAHPNLGLPLIGVDTGIPCSAGSPCNAALGHYCDAIHCRAYPIVDDTSELTFTGTSFWDRQGLVRFKPLNPLLADETFNTVVTPYLEGPPATNDERCTVHPTRWDENIGGPVDTAVCALQPPTKCNETAIPDEKWRDKVKIEPGENKGTLYTSLNLVAGEFYEVEFVNQNGDYFVFGEPVPADPVAARALARTIHVCTNDPSDLQNGTCDLVNVPVGSGFHLGLDPNVASCLDANGAVVTCSAATGGVWRSPPCATPGGCPETPAEFASETTVDSAKLMVYVGDSNAEQFVNSKISGVRCFDETGWDGGGEDELVVIVWSGEAKFDSEDFDAEDLVRRANAKSYGIDSKSNEPSNYWKTNRGDGSWMASVPLPVRAQSGTQASGGVIVVEEDDSAPAAIVATLGFAVGAAAVGTVSPVGAGIAGGVGVTVVTAILLTGPDDYIGSRQWSLSVADVSSRGQAAHSNSSLTKPIPLLSQEAASHVVSVTSLDHAAVDGDMLAFSDELTARPLVSCSTAKDCGRFGAGGCVANVCVGFSTCISSADCLPYRRCAGGYCLPHPRQADGSCFMDFSMPPDGVNDQDTCWDDHTLAPASAAPILPGGHVELQRFNGAGTDYDVYTVHSLSEQDASKVQ